MTKRTRVESLVVAIRKSKRQGASSLPAAKRRALVREFGTDAIRALLIAEHPKWQAEVFELDEAGCPWAYGVDAKPLEVAKRALGPLAKRLPKLVALLGSAERVVVAHHEPEADAPDRGGWFLVYALPTDAGPQLWIAGPPTPEPSFALAGWSLPEPLHELYARHDGLGLLCDEFGWTGVDPGVQPAIRLSHPALELADDDDPLDPHDLLRFTRGTGEAGESGWCFARGAKQALSVRHLDDQFGLLGRPVPFDFWGFLDRYLIGDPHDELPSAESY